MKKLLYYDCFSGISGDMNLGAMIDLGVDADRLRRELALLPLRGYEIRVRREKRRGVEGTRVEVALDGEAHEHGHEHGHEHRHDHDVAESRSFADIRRLIEESGLSARVKELSLRIFTRVAEAEGRIHGIAPEQVHFHEVGAVDSIVDIVGAAICHEALGVEQVVAGPVELGSGFAKCAHGTFPVPAPATAEILKGIPARTGGVPFEATTPTGAAILATLARRFASVFALEIQKVGYGLGAKDGPVPNALRVFLAEEAGEEAGARGGAPAAAAAEAEDGTTTEEAVLVECNLDDMSPERYDHVMELLFRQGAMDVFLTPIVMKKSRPAVTLSVLCGSGELAAVRETLFAHTTTLGVRETPVSKRMLGRREATARSPYGDVRVKQALYRGRVLRSKPEYDDVRRLALEHGVTIDEVVQKLGAPEDGNER